MASEVPLLATADRLTEHHSRMLGGRALAVGPLGAIAWPLGAHNTLDAARRPSLTTDPPAPLRTRARCSVRESAV
jgi:hypothetical protein